jgi:hypothetical protein
MNKARERDLPPIVNFAAIDFWYHNRAHSEIQLMTRLSLSSRVLFINSIGMRAPLPGRSSNSGFRILRKIKSLLRGLRRPLAAYPNFYVLSPIIIPAYSTPWLRKINYAAIYIQVRFAMLWLGMKKPIIFETIPTSNDVAKKLPHSLEVVNRVDKMSAFSETDQTYIESLEQDQISRAQRTYYTSQLLLSDEESLHQGKGKFLDHGVDIDLFVPRDSDERPDELRDIDTKIIGFFGGIDDYVLDLELVHDIATTYPACTLVLIGEATCDITHITSVPNVLHLGFRSVHDVAQLGAYFDVAILPRRNDEWTKYTNPIKIKEYLALGLNVVTMNIPEVTRYSDDLFIADDAAEFLQLIGKALETESTAKDREHLRNLVKNDTWDQRTIEVVTDLKELV